MTQFQLKKPVVIGIASVFALLLIFGFWRKLNPAFDKNSYYRDAAKSSAVEEAVTTTTDEKGSAVPSVASDKAYQPEKGSD